MINKFSSLIKAHPFIALVVTLVLLVFAYYFRGSIKQSWSSHQVNKQDQQLQQQVDASEKAAAESEGNANTYRDTRLEQHGRTAKAEEDRQAAAVNSNRTIDPVRKARQRYEETRRTRPANSPDISDADLCAELTKRGIACN